MKQNKFFTKQIILVLTILLSGMNSFQTVTVIDATDKYDNIDGLKSRWYKIKLAEGQYGWVYGGYVKIYVDEQSKQQLLKAFAEPGSEDTNNQRLGIYES